MNWFKQFLFLFLWISIQETHAQTIFTESLGSVSSTTSLATHETNNGFDNDVYTMDQGGAVTAADLRSTSASTGYAGSSGGANVWFTNTSGEYGFAIKGINTSTCTSLSLSFAVRKENAAGTPFASLTLEYSNNSGTNWNSLSFTAPASTAGAGWYLISGLTLPAGAYTNNLWLRWRKTGTLACRVDDITLGGVCPTTTIATGILTGSPFSLTCSSGTNGSINFTSTGTFSPGNNFNVQLSDASGSFVSPTTVGSLDSASSVGVNPAATIAFSIPAGLPSGNYSLRIVSTSPITTSNSTVTFTITLVDGPCNFVPPHFSMVLINSCGNTCTEGRSEIIYGTTGDYSILVNNANFDMSYGSIFPLTNYTDNLVSNPTVTASINNLAGCTGTFLDGTGQTLPPNSTFILAPNTLCPEDITWSSLCGTGPIYMIYLIDADWNANGNFKNGNTGGLRYFNSAIRATNGQLFSLDYNYNSTLLQSGAAADGDYITFGSNGGAASYGDNNCLIAPTIVLPTSLLSFSGFDYNRQVQLNWTTASEQSNAFFTLSHSSDGYKFEPIGTIQGAGNSDELIDYQFVHNSAVNGLNYYQLHSTDVDGYTYKKGMISVIAKRQEIVYNLLEQCIEVPKRTNLCILSADGRVIFSGEVNNRLSFLESGLFFIQDINSGEIIRLLIP